MKKQRVSWIDVARGIGIILVVYGHALSADSFRYLIYSFHMPLFFFLSGLVFPYRTSDKLPGVFVKNVRGLLYPYFLFAMLSFLLWILTKSPSYPEQLKQFLSIFYGNGNNNLLAFNNLLWFLPCLFITRLGFYMIRRVSDGKNILILILAGFSVIGYLYSLYLSDWKLPFGLETALTAIVFFGVGFLWKAHERAQELFMKFSWLLLLLMLITCGIFAYLNFRDYGLQVDLRQDRLNNYAYFYLAAFGGIASTLAISQLIRQNVLLEYLGKNSLIIFSWHLIIFHYLSPVFRFTGVSALLSLLPRFVSPITYSLTSIIVVLGISRLLSLLLEQLRKGVKKLHSLPDSGS